MKYFLILTFRAYSCNAGSVFCAAKAPGAFFLVALPSPVCCFILVVHVVSDLSPYPCEWERESGEVEATENSPKGTARMMNISLTLPSNGQKLVLWPYLTER